MKMELDEYELFDAARILGVDLTEMRPSEFRERLDRLHDIFYKHFARRARKVLDKKSVAGVESTSLS